jgi:hypothetical protein
MIRKCKISAELSLIFISRCCTILANHLNKDFILYCMKRVFTLGILCLAACFILTSALMDDNGRAGYTGSPGETTCNITQCHNSFAINSGGGSVTATSTMNNWVYAPNTTYTISIKVAKTGVHLFGLGCELLTYANTNAGTIVITNSHNQIKTRTVSGVSRKSVVHTLNGGASQDSMIFTFNWTSPDTSTGIITMYFCGNAANANTMPTGDYIYSNSQVITPLSSTTGIADIPAGDIFSVYPNPVSDKINLHFTLKSKEMVKANLTDLSGRKSFVLFNKELPEGTNTISCEVPEGCSGIYILSLESPSGRSCKKISIN